ncbi:metalloprotease TldD [Rhodospirillaceae bacterium KN72]|uniref:Metalloprotease TldD n=1 Tax=Pacificispira spongiicola TaxID=2729598 RepID=A0A7Y0DYB4_9PROT|nr:metalloprotease TldD [Pacificispira spongiicola]NMM43728.1 metalloprotease TldD [Pacificispira spongiicola]
MSDIATTDALFFDNTGLDRSRVESLVADSLHGAEDGEIYMEYVQSENLFLEDGKIKSASFDTSQGFGLRSVIGEVSGYAHSGELSEEAIKRAGEAVRAVHSGHSGTLAGPPPRTNMALYSDVNPLETLGFDAKVGILSEIDAYARAKDPRVKQVFASLAAEWSAIQIIRPDGERAADIRPLVRVNISVAVEENGRMETGSQGCGGRLDFAGFVTPDQWKAQVDEALRQALVNLAAEPAPAGEMTVVLGPGWPGVLLHEAVGHGLEGDFNRKGTSAFAGLIGERVAAPGVTVVDNGTLKDRRGSLTVDDEGTPTSETMLIEDGILKGYMQDRMNARLMGVQSTGNGRRQSYAHCPMVRMTNTYMLAGDRDPGEILASVDKGVYAVNFGGGQVDITNGKFVFSCTEAYRIENGKLGAPLKGATLIGNGADALTKVSMIGNDLKLDDGIGTCGKEGQGVPVGVGQPTLRLDGLTVGGTAA